MQIYCITSYKWEGKSAFESPSCFLRGEKMNSSNKFAFQEVNNYLERYISF